MKKIGVLMLAMAIMAVSSVMAAGPATGFHLDNDIAVSGDYQWMGSNWQITNPVTATFEMDIDSNMATLGQFTEAGNFGTPWHLDYSSIAAVNAPTKFKNVLNAQTINPPSTTPGTDWTKVKYTQTTSSDFSGSSLAVSGYGDVYVSSTLNAQGQGFQDVALNIN